MIDKAYIAFEQLVQFLFEVDHLLVLLICHAPGESGCDDIRVDVRAELVDSR